MKPMAAHISVRGAIDGIAHRHIVGRYGLRDGPSRPAHPEKPTGDLLPSPDFGEGPVSGGIQIDAKGLLMRAGYFLIHHKINFGRYNACMPVRITRSTSANS